MGQHGSPAWWGFFLWKCLEQLPCRVTHFLLLCHILVRPVWQRLFSLCRCLSLLSPTSEAWDDVNGSAPGRMRQDFQETASKPQTSKKKKEKNPKREEKKNQPNNNNKKPKQTIKKDRTIFFPSFLGAREAGGQAGLLLTAPRSELSAHLSSAFPGGCATSLGLTWVGQDRGPIIPPCTPPCLQHKGWHGSRSRAQSHPNPLQSLLPSNSHPSFFPFCMLRAIKAGYSQMTRHHTHAKKPPAGLPLSCL